MGFIDSFKKKPTHLEKLDLAYRCYKPETVGMIFPGGKAQANRVITSLSKIYGVNLDASDAKKYYDILTTYSDVVIRKVITQSSDDHIIDSLQMKHEDLIHSDDIAQKALTFITRNMNNNDYSIESEGDIAALNSTTNCKMKTTEDYELEREAHEKGISVEHLREIREIEKKYYDEREKIEKKRQEEQERHKRGLIETAKRVQQKYSDFVLEKEMKDPIFAALMDDEYDMIRAYEYIHKNELFERRKDAVSISAVPLCNDNQIFNDLLKEELKSKPAEDDFLSRPYAEQLREAEKLNVPIAGLIEVKKAERECENLRWGARVDELKKLAQRAYEVKKKVPEFDVIQEMKNGTFAKLIENVDMFVAYELIHFDDYYVAKKPDTLVETIGVRQTGFARVRHCEKCGTLCPADSNFCHKCGAKMPEQVPRCEKCGVELQPESLFCHKCGTKVIRYDENEEVVDVTSSLQNDETEQQKIEIEPQKIEQQSDVCMLAKATVDVADRFNEKNSNAFITQMKLTQCDIAVFCCFLLRAFCLGASSSEEKALAFNEEYVDDVIDLLTKKYSCDAFDPMDVFKNRMSFYDDVFASKNDPEKRFMAVLEEFEYVIRTDVINKKFVSFGASSPLPITGFDTDWIIQTETMTLFNELPTLVAPYFEKVQQELSK